MSHSITEPQSAINRRLRTSMLALGIGLPLLFSSVGLGLIFGFATVTNFSCQRSSAQSGQCTLTTLRGPLAWEERKTLPLDTIESLEIVSQRQMDSSDRTYYLMLETTQEDFSLHSSTHPETLQPIVDKVSTFVTNKAQTTVEIKFPDTRWVLYMMGGIFLIVPTIITVPLVYFILKSNSQSVADSILASNDPLFSHSTDMEFDSEFFSDDNLSFSEMPSLESVMAANESSVAESETE